jgi:hypothetical protein
MQTNKPLFRLDLNKVGKFRVMEYLMDDEYIFHGEMFFPRFEKNIHRKRVLFRQAFRLNIATCEHLLTTTLLCSVPSKGDVHSLLVPRLRQLPEFASGRVRFCHIYMSRSRRR